MSGKIATSTCGEASLPTYVFRPEQGPGSGYTLVCHLIPKTEAYYPRVKAPPDPPLQGCAQASSTSGAWGYFFLLAGEWGGFWQPLGIIISSFAWYNSVFSQVCLRASRCCRAYGNSAKAEESSPWFPKPTPEVYPCSSLLLLTMRQQRGCSGNADRDHVLGQNPASS